MRRDASCLVPPHEADVHAIVSVCGAGVTPPLGSRPGPGRLPARPRPSKSRSLALIPVRRALAGGRIEVPPLIAAVSPEMPFMADGACPTRRSSGQPSSRLKRRPGSTVSKGAGDSSGSPAPRAFAVTLRPPPRGGPWVSAHASPVRPATPRPASFQGDQGLGYNKTIRVISERRAT